MYSSKSVRYGERRSLRTDRFRSAVPSPMSTTAAATGTAAAQSTESSNAPVAARRGRKRKANNNLLSKNETPEESLASDAKHPTGYWRIDLRRQHSALVGNFIYEELVKQVLLRVQALTHTHTHTHAHTHTHTTRVASASASWPCSTSVRSFHWRAASGTRAEELTSCASRRAAP